MSQITFLNVDEMRTMQGLSLEAKVLYVFELRRYADENGVTGLVRRHSFQSFKEQLTVVPDWGSKQQKSSNITVGKLRAIIAELERHGLLEKQPEPLVFRLPMATRHESVQKRNDRGTTRIATQGTTAGTTQGTTQGNLTAAKDTEEGTTQGTTSGTTVGTTRERAEERHTSPITAFTTSTTAREVETGHRRAFALTLDWKPSDLFDQRAKPQGVDPALLTPFMLAAFVSHYEAEGRTNNQGQWENLLVKWIKREQGSPQVAASPDRHARPSSPQQPINAITDPNAYVLPLLQPRKEKEIPAEERQRQLAELRRMRGLPV